MQAPPSSNAVIARRVAVAALLIAVGNIASRVLGLVREMVIAGFFDRSVAVDAFTAASALPTIVYDLLISGAISAALVPVLSEYIEQHDDAEFWRIASTIINLALLVTAAVTALLIWQAPATIALLAGGFAPSIRAEATTMVQWLLPSVLFMGLSGLITAILYARQQFLLPAFTTSAYNLGIILGAALLTPWLGVLSLVVGVLVGALLQVMLQLPGLRGAKYQFRLELGHPGVRRILWLYAPVALGIGFSVIGIVLDRNLASGLSNNALSTMRFATTLIQFPLGLVAAAVSFAVLPTLSRQASNADNEAFRTTLAMGLKVVLLLILPATVGLATLSAPLVGLLFERGDFGRNDTIATAQALLLYLPGLPAAAVDQVLLFALYARKRTLAPNLVQGAAIAIYALVALSLLQFTTLQIEALVLGNSAQWIAHMLILLLLGGSMLSGPTLRIVETLLKCTLASGVMALVVLGSASLSAPFGYAAQVVLAGLLGALSYFAACWMLRVEALQFFVRAIQQRLRRSRSGF
jgi:putative peptidoglycan lipid II flippase